jgi:hypothetical protein
MSFFSQRRGLKPVKSVVQVDSIDIDLRNALWDVFRIFCWPEEDEIPVRMLRATSNLCVALWHGYFKRPVDTIPNFAHSARRELREYFFGCEWYEAYDFVEFVANNFPDGSTQEQFIEECNAVLERELSAYRFVGARITEITSENEISEIEQVLDSSSLLRPVTAHMKRALDLLADRRSPDYRNSIKESISAVEAMCNLIVNSSSATLGQALNELEKKKTVPMHPALKGAFQKLYGYTSDADGIRHALLEESDLGFEDAKFMMVSCSAFINYLKMKATKARIGL